MKAPSIQRLQHSFGVAPQTAKTARLLIQNKLKTTDSTLFPKTYAWVASCYNLPLYLERLMSALDETLGTHGVEAVWGQSVTQPVATYLNTGDAYSPTLLLFEGSIHLTTLGDFVEKNGARLSIQ